MTRSKRPVISDRSGETHGVGRRPLAAVEEKLVPGTVDDANNGAGVSAFAGLVEELLKL